MGDHPGAIRPPGSAVARMWGRVGVGALAIVLAASACSHDDGGGAGTATREVVEELSADRLQGRDNATPGSEQAQALLVTRLQEVAEPLPGAVDGYRWPIPSGTNLLGMVPGGDLADQYVVVGAHYDHLGTSCRRVESGDSICNGAQDNATGVAAVLELARSLATGDETPRRSVIIALWDREEDGFAGSLDFVTHPPVPLDEVVAYVNFDLLGANQLPSLADTTFMIGAETGGPTLVDAAEEAASAGPLTTVTLSLDFGEESSDHASFTGSGVPSVFFTDGPNGCYHSTSDELAVVDVDKVAEERATGEQLVRELATADARPEFTSGTPSATYDDAVAVLDMVERSQADTDLLRPGDRPLVQGYLDELTAIVDAGPEAFDAPAVSRLLSGANDLVGAFTRTACSGYLE